jgi:endonuclease/exonuclease/phosphatase family metal-dependent hydrolase
MTALGTRPGGAWPFSVAIDDVFVSPGSKVVSWKTVAIPGSDHAAVVAEVWVPRGTKK